MTEAGYEKRFDQMKGFLVGDGSGRKYSELAVALDMSESAVKVTVHRMRRRFAALLRKEVEDTVESREAVAEEIRYLIEALGS